eukprot:GHVU01104572.1.p1 GENE.GHVU01104572.1~~GHVU01104572.1.p1  ORF type:complete len:142 (-),score=13.69 GHVU01104572.1:89-514(-)
MIVRNRKNINMNTCFMLPNILKTLPAGGGPLDLAVSASPGEVATGGLVFDAAQAASTAAVTAALSLAVLVFIATAALMLVAAATVVLVAAVADAALPTAGPWEFPSVTNATSSGRVLRVEGLRVASVLGAAVAAARSATEP